MSKSKQAAQVEIDRLKKLIGIEDRKVRRWKNPDLSSTDLARHELKEGRRAIRGYQERIRALEIITCKK